MKIEKLTENKIRILISGDDANKSNFDLHSIMTKAAESQGLFLEMLNQAEEQVGFNTEGYKLLVEAYSSLDNDFIFTITKYLEGNEKEINSDFRKKNVFVKRKTMDLKSNNITYVFDSFDSFCNLCSCLNYSKSSIKTLSKHSALYFYNDYYYLIFKEINENNTNCKSIFSILSEFGDLIHVSKNFESKLLEYGELFIEKNVLTTGIKFFSKK